MPSSFPDALTPVASFVQALRPRRVLDVGIGFGKCGLLFREYLEVGTQPDRGLTFSARTPLFRALSGILQGCQRIDVLAVHPLGYVPAEELRALYRGACMLVYPSFYEGFGLPVLEAMASGTPVVTYRLTSLPEVAGEAAILLDPPVSPSTLAAAITRVLEDPALRIELIGRGLEQAKRFSWRTAARLTLDVYEALA